MNISSCNTSGIHGIRDRLKKDKIMNALQKTALGLTFLATTAFSARAQSGNQLAFNDNAKSAVVSNEALTNYTSAIRGNASAVGTHTHRSGTIGMMVYGPPGSKNLEAKANELFNTYKPHVDDFIVTYQEHSDFKEILVGVVHKGNARQGAYAIDAMIQGYKKVLGSYDIPISTTTVSLASADLDHQ